MVSSEFPVAAEAASSGVGLLDPIVLFTALAIGALIAGAAYYFGRRGTEDAMWRAREDAAASIHKAILDKARTAAAATRPQVMGAAQGLVDEIDRLLGPVAAIGAFGSAVARLKGGLEGKPPPEAKPDDDHGHGGGHGHDDHAPPKDDHGHGKPGEHGEGSHPATRHSPSINISIGDVSHAAHGHKPDHKPAPAKGVDIDAIRSAVLAFTDYWSRPTMVAELKAAQRALVTPAPKSVLKPAGTH